MVPRITSKGKSFKGAGAYFLHDLGKAQTAERVAFTYTVNMLTDDPEKAVKVMAWTAAHAQDLKEVSGQKRTGRKAENPVYNYSLAWAPDQNPTRADMIQFGLQSLKTLGVAEHEALFIAHDDTAHKHLHVMLNRVHPVTGLMAKMDHDQNKLSRLAQAYEEETGRVYCPQRVDNNRRRDLGEKYVKASDVDRLAETPEYQARRASRMAAQREAGARALEKLWAVPVKDRQGPVLRPAFDQTASADDRQPRPHTGPANDHMPQALDEQGKAAREAAIDAKRVKESDSDEAKQWQTLNDRQTTEREGLREVHAAMLLRLDARLAQKYASLHRAALRRIEDLQTTIQTTSVRRLIDRVTGRALAKVTQLAELQTAAKRLEAQRDEEYEAYAIKQVGQREAQARSHARECQALAEKLTASKARRALSSDREKNKRAGPGTVVAPPVPAKALPKRPEEDERRPPVQPARPNKASGPRR